MTKVSEVRSALRRLALTKAADAYEDIVNGYANAYNRKGSITAPGVRASANANLRAQGYKPGRPSAPVPVAQPNAAADAAFRKAQDAGAMVAVASLVPLDADRYLQFISKNRDGKNILSWLGDAAHLYRWQEYYNALTVQMARAFGCRLVDLRTAFLQSRNFLDLLCPDGIHPTDSGYALVHKTLSAAMY